MEFVINSTFLIHYYILITTLRKNSISPIPDAIQIFAKNITSFLPLNLPIAKITQV